MKKLFSRYVITLTAMDTLDDDDPLLDVLADKDAFSIIADGVKGVVEDCFTGSHADVRVLRNEVVEE